MEVSELTFFQAQQISGPNAVFLRISFGKSAQKTRLIPLPKIGTKDKEIDTTALLRDTHAGVSQANEEFHESLVPIEIQYVPNDYPAEGQVKMVAYQLAKAAIAKNIKAATK